MNTRWISLALRAAGWGLFALAVAWPTAALLVRCLADGTSPAAGFTFTPRQLGLLWRTLWMSGAATAGCLVLALPAAFALGRSGGPARRPLLAALLLMGLLAPPMVCVFAWQRMLPTGLDPQLRCVALWSLWAWPIPAFVLSAGWSRTARSAHEAASLSVSPWAAFTRVALPSLTGHIALAALIVFVLFFGDYGVPHACGLSVYATEVLGWAQESSRTIDVLWPGLPGVAIVAVGVWGILRLASRLAPDAAGDTSAAPPPGRGGLMPLLVTFALGGVSWAVPIGYWAARFGSVEAQARAVGVYGEDLAWSLVVALAAGVGVVVTGFGVIAWHGASGWHAHARVGMASRALVAWTVLLGALPGGLIGVAMVAAFNNDFGYVVYDGWVVMGVSYVARFAWIGLVAGLLVTGGLAPGQSPIAAQARTDGADAAALLTRVQAPMHLPLLAAAVLVVAVLSLADVAATSLVRPPTYNPIAHVLIEKYHRFEDDMLVSLSLWLVCAALPAGAVGAWVMRRRG